MRPPATLNYNLEVYKSTTVVASGAQGAGQTEHLTYTNSTNKAVTITIKVFGIGGASSAASPYYLTAVF